MQRIELKNGDVIIGDIVEVDPSTMVYTIKKEIGSVCVKECEIKRITKEM